MNDLVDMSSLPALEFYRNTEDVVTELEEMDTEHIQQSGQTENNYGVKEFFADKSLWKPLAIACMLQVAQQFSGINAVSSNSRRN